MVKLSPYAKMFYIEWLLNPDSVRYNMIVIDELRGDLDVERFKQAVYKYVQNHLLLHSHLEIKRGEPHWVPNETIKGMDYSEKSATNEELLAYINRPFNLYDDQLCRFKLFRVRAGLYQFVGVMQHLVVDGLSYQEGVFEELSRYYNEDNHSAGCSLSFQREKLTELADFFNEQLSFEKPKYQKFWAEQLKDIEPIDLCFLKRTTHPQQKIALDQYNLTKKIQFEFDASIISRLAQLKRKYLVTPYYFGLCVFATLLHRYSGQNKFVVPYPVAIKKGSGFIYGAQVNTSLMPFQFERNSTFLDILNKNTAFLKSTKSEVGSYINFPSIELFNESNKHLLNVVFNQANFREKTFRFEKVAQKSLLNNFNMYLQDMLLFEQEQKEGVLYYQVRYDIAQMDEMLVQNFVDNFQRMFKEILHDLEHNIVAKPVQDYSLLTSEMYQHLLIDLNNTKKAFPEQKTIHCLFEEQVKKTPDRIAVIFGDVQLTYHELNLRADRLAALIYERYHPELEELVLLHFERSHYMIIAILAVLKAGCAYVPVSPGLPENTLCYIVKDTKAKLILTNEAHTTQLIAVLQKMSDELSGVRGILSIDGHASESLPGEPCLPKFKQFSTSLAYVLFTSGSSGNPKGVMMEHKACVNRIVDMITISQVTNRDTILFKTNYIFDVSFSDIFIGLLAGACVVVTKEVFDIGEIAHAIEKQAVTVCHFTPSQFETIKNIKGTRLFQQLRVIHFSGEALHPKLLRDIDEKISCINYYGPTEAGEAGAEIKGSSLLDCATIGYPMANVQFYLLDKVLKPVPVGVIGELYIGGEALARGYLNQPQLTHQSFIQNPFQSPDDRNKNKNSQLYRTGDLARRLLNGNIEYKGRNDSQVKIRGYRIELGEIENQLKKFPDIKQSVVLSRGKNQPDNFHFEPEKFLVAYYTTTTKLEPSQLREYLAKQLPSYMVPDFFLRLDEFPLTANGKLDIKALPSIKLSVDSEYRPPRNGVEERICASYAEVLELPIEKVGINDDFFQLGGTSILAIRLLCQLGQHLDIKISDVFTLRTPAKIAETVKHAKNILEQKKENIRQFYIKYNYADRDYCLEKEDTRIAPKYADYLKDIKSLEIKEVKSIRNVLLTGATGHLGCNILGKLLFETPYKIYLLTRADTDELAFSRVAQKFRFYFDDELNNYRHRLVVLSADIQQAGFNLEDKQFNLLIDQIDSIIHCAALVKHYGEYEKFYQSNVQPTINLLELTRFTRGKDFHYISTVGVLSDGYVPQENYHLSCEGDNAEEFVHGNNFYVQTKYKSELLVAKYRSHGVSGNIYRIGNLGMHSVNHKVQQNIEENMFFSHLKTVLNLGMIPEEISHVEISPVDFTAAAIVKLFDKVALNNQTHHVFNPNLCDLTKVFKALGLLKVNKCTIIEFINVILSKLSENKVHENEHMLALYHLWYQESNEIHTTRMRIAQEKTEAILNKLDFYWPVITPTMMTDFVKHAFPSSQYFRKEVLNDL